MVAAALLLTGCASGLETVRGDEGFVACMDKAGVDLAHRSDWSRPQQRSIMSRAAPQRCALDDLDAEQRSSVIGYAFEAASAAQRLAALRTFVGAQREKPDSIARDVGLLLAAQDSADDEPKNDKEAWAEAWAEERPQWLLAVAIYEQVHGSVPGLDGWVSQHGGQRTDEVILDFVEAGEGQGSDIYQQLERLHDVIDRTRDDAA